MPRQNLPTVLPSALVDHLVEQIDARCGERMEPIMEALATLLAENRYLHERVERLEYMLGVIDENGNEPDVRKPREMPTA